MKITAWMVLLSEGGMESYYIDMALKSILPHVDSIYIQDQGCTDDTIAVAKAIVGDKVPLHVEEISTGLPRFHPDYDEPHFRSLALKGAEEVFEPEWLLKIDADDFYTEHFWEQVRAAEASGKLAEYNSVRHGSDRFVMPGYRACSPHAKQVVDGYSYYDPHVHLWRAGLGVEFIQNAELTGFMHCVTFPQPDPSLWIPGVCNIHFHKSFGPKSFPFWHEGGDVFDDTIPFNPKEQAPNWFAHDLNMGTAVKSHYVFPNYVIKKWKKWGVYPGYDWEGNRIKN